MSRETTRAWLAKNKLDQARNEHFNTQSYLSRWNSFPWNRDGNPNTDEIRKAKWKMRDVLYFDFEIAEMAKKFPELEQP